MPELTIVRSYQDGEVLMEADVDNLSSTLAELNNTTKFDSDNLQSQSITEEHLIDDSVTAAVIADKAVTTDKFQDEAVTAVKVIDGEIDTVNIADSAITTAKVADTAIVSSKFSSSRLPLAKLSDKAYFTANGGTYTINENAGETTIASLVTSQSARNLFILLQPMAGTTSEFGIRQGLTSTDPFPGFPSFRTKHLATIRIKYNGVTQATRTFGFSNGLWSYVGGNVNSERFLYIPISTIALLGSSAASGVTISVTAELQTSLGTGDTNTPAQLFVTNCKLVCVEL